MSAAGAKILAAPIFGEGHSTRSFAKPIPTPRILVTFRRTCVCILLALGESAWRK